MKNHFLILSFIVLFSACQNNKTESQTQTITNAIDETPNQSDLLVKAIMGTGDGSMRGVKLGDDIEIIKKKETLALIEDENTAEHIGYTLEMPTLETADVFYKKGAKNKLSGIDIDIYPNNKAELELTLKALDKHFTDKYGKAINPNLWQDKNIEVTIKNLSKEKLPLINIEFKQVVIL